MRSGNPISLRSSLVSCFMRWAWHHLTSQAINQFSNATAGRVMLRAGEATGAVMVAMEMVMIFSCG